MKGWAREVAVSEHHAQQGHHGERRAQRCAQRYTQHHLRHQAQHNASLHVQRCFTALRAREVDRRDL